MSAGRGVSAADRRFREFHQDHPEIYRELMHLVRQARLRGQKKIGIKMLWEVMRWNRLLRNETYSTSIITAATRG